VPLPKPFNDSDIVTSVPNVTCHVFVVDLRHKSFFEGGIPRIDL
jgi:hypothetical protein